MSGYPNRAESEHDWIENSHASTGLSYAHGIASGFELRGIDGERKVVAVVGDGALTGGMAYEALNNLGHSRRRVVIVLNDNGRSYAPTVSQLSQSLTTLRLNPTYTAARERVRLRLRELPALGELAYSGVHSVTSALRDMVAPHTFFEALGVRYAGPIDGHDVEHMEQAFTHAAAWDGPIVVHVLTQKGRGYAPAEEDDIQRLHDVKATKPIALENTVGNSAGRGVGGSATSDGGGIASPGSTSDERDRRIPAARRHLYRSLLTRTAGRGRRRPARGRAHCGHARSDGPAGLPGPLSRSLLRRRDRRATWGHLGRRHGHGRVAARRRRVLDVLVTLLRPGEPRRGPARLPRGLRARPGRHHRRRRPEPPRDPRPGPGALHPGHDGVHAVVGRGGRADVAHRPGAAGSIHHPRAQDRATTRRPRRRRERARGAPATRRRRVPVPHRRGQDGGGLPDRRRRAGRRGDRRHRVGRAGDLPARCRHARRCGAPPPRGDGRGRRPPRGSRRLPARRHGVPAPTQRACRHRPPGCSVSRASTSHRAGPTTSSPASASTAPASRRACARSESASPSSPAPTERQLAAGLATTGWRRSGARSRSPRSTPRSTPPRRPRSLPARRAPSGASRRSGCSRR